VYERVVVAVDSSEQSERATQRACALAKLSGGTVHLVHVRERQDVIGKSGGSFDIEYPEEAQAVVDGAQAVFKAAGVPVTSKIVHAPIGHVADEIVKTAEESGSDTIVMGSHGRSGLGAVILGSNAYKVVHLSARAAVLIVR
jgi:nucleotide-binding universal stress UspA family protein